MNGEGSGPPCLPLPTLRHCVTTNVYFLLRNLPTIDLHLTNRESGVADEAIALQFESENEDLIIFIIVQLTLLLSAYRLPL